MLVQNLKRRAGASTSALDHEIPLYLPKVPWQPPIMAQTIRFRGMRTRNATGVGLESSCQIDR